MRAMTIGQVARLAGIGIETVRYYERQGLIPEPPRTRSGYRQYPEEVVSRLRFIRRAQDLGFALKEINELLNLRLDVAANRAEVRARAEAKIRDIEETIHELQNMWDALTRLTRACSAGGPAPGCPILEALKSIGSEHENLST